jgi:dephospho-CoA kinase
MKKRDSFSDEQIDHRLQNQVSKEERTKWIKKIQSKYEDRYLLNITWDNYNLDDIYQQLITEYNNRKKNILIINNKK